MIIRGMAERDVEAVSQVCMDSFSQSVAETLSEEGVSTFSRIAERSAFLDRMKGDSLILVAEGEGGIYGMIELKEERHVAMLFVAPDRPKQGVGKMLLLAALVYAKVNTVTVRASLSSVPAYKKYGFECAGDTGESAGLIYQPMRIEL